MYQPYLDIMDRLGVPLWWDENGVPRYEPFEPRLCADIYNRYCALIEIRCQACGKLFPVASSWSIKASPSWAESDVVWDESGKIARPKSGFPTPDNSGFCGYGDAPFHPLDGQCSGTTMMTDVVRVLQFWTRAGHEDKRCPEYEVEINESSEPAE